MNNPELIALLTLEKKIPSEHIPYIGRGPVPGTLDINQVNVQLLHPNAQKPKVNQAGDVGADLYACEAGIVPASGRRLIDTGIILELPAGYRASVRSRSGLSLDYGIEAGAGLIDCSYRKTLGVLLYNHSMKDWPFKAGDRIAQICIERYSYPVFEVVDVVSQTARTEGWGSSGM